MGSIEGVSTYIWVVLGLNVSKYAIHLSVWEQGIWFVHNVQLDWWFRIPIWNLREDLKKPLPIVEETTNEPSQLFFPINSTPLAHSSFLFICEEILLLPSTYVKQKSSCLFESFTWGVILPMVLGVAMDSHAHHELPPYWPTRFASHGI